MLNIKKDGEEDNENGDDHKENEKENDNKEFDPGIKKLLKELKTKNKKEEKYHICDLLLIHNNDEKTTKNDEKINDNNINKQNKKDYNDNNNDFIGIEKINHILVEKYRIDKKIFLFIIIIQKIILINY